MNDADQDPKGKSSGRKWTKPVFKTLPVFLLPIDDLGLPKRVCNSLKAENIFHIGDLIQFSPLEVRNIPDIGVLAFGQIQLALAINGWTLGTPLPGYRELFKATFETKDQRIRLVTLL